MNIAVLSDERFISSVPGDNVLSLDARPPRETMSMMLDDGIELIIVVGDDRTLARVMTARLEHNRDRAERVDVCLVSAGEFPTVADAIGAPEFSDNAIEKVIAAAKRNRLERREIRSLRIVDSATTSAELAFSFGMGLPCEYFEQYSKSDRGGRIGAAASFAQLARERLGSRAGVEADVFADWEHRAEQFGYLIVSTVERSWFDVAMGEGPSFRLGKAPLDLVGARSRVGRFMQRATGKGAETFRRIHIDTNSRYVVDGEVVGNVKPRTVTITEGPKLRCLVP